MSGSVSDLQAMFAIFFSPPDNPRLNMSPITESLIYYSTCDLIKTFFLAYSYHDSNYKKHFQSN